MVSDSALAVVDYAESAITPSLQPICVQVTVLDDLSVSFESLDPTVASSSLHAALDTCTVLLDCDSVQQAVLTPPFSRIAIKNGRLVAWRYVEQGVATFA